MRCVLCPRNCPPTDRLPVQGGFAHWQCIVRIQLDKSPRGKVLVMVGRKGFRGAVNAR
jgi:hypothetical protein